MQKHILRRKGTTFFQFCKIFLQKLIFYIDILYLCGLDGGIYSTYHEKRIITKQKIIYYGKSI